MPKNLLKSYVLEPKISRLYFWLFGSVVFVATFLVWVKWGFVAFGVKQSFQAICAFAPIRTVSIFFSSFIYVWRLNNINKPRKLVIYYALASFLSIVLGAIFLQLASYQLIILERSDFSYCGATCSEEEGLGIEIAFFYFLGTSFMLFLPNPLEVLLWIKIAAFGKD